MLAALLAVAALQNVPARVEVTVFDSELARTGSFSLELKFDPDEDIDVAYSIRLELRSGGNVILNRDHSPAPPTRMWKKGKEVRYEIEAAFPLEAPLGEGDLEVWLGFYDGKTRATLAPLGFRSGMARVATLARPAFAASVDTDKAIEEARALKKEGKGPAAWNTIETALRLAQDDPSKRKLAAELVKISDFAAPPATSVEQGIVAGRLLDEKHRYWRLVAGQLYDRGEFAGALRLMEIVGGSIEEQAETAVIGAVDDAARATQDIERVEMALLRQISDDEKKVADAEIARHGMSEKLLARAEEYVKQKKYPIARRLLDETAKTASGAVQKAADERLAELEPIQLKHTPPEQQAKVDAAIHHEVWARTETAVSHRFIFIGPKDLVSTIPAESKRRFDVAYVYLTDFFGRKPNPGGDRVTVYFKELWNFGGATGGGTTINVGNARADARGTRVDTALYYHELTHCIDDFTPDFGGIHEGLANLGAAVGLEGVGDEAASKAALKRALEAFEIDYVARDLEYWRIPEYDPSCGLFAHFIERYGKKDGQYEWQRYRRFFRAYRDAPFRDGREPNVARAMAFYLQKFFAPSAFEDLIGFRFPLQPSDRAAIEEEMALYERGVRRLRDGDVETIGPNSPARWDKLYQDLFSASEARVEAARDGLGIITNWIVTGPFGRQGVDPDTFVFPPEYETDFSKEYQGQGHLCQWMRPDPSKPVTVKSTGWIDFGFTYRENAAFYALCFVTVDADMDAVAHYRCDDDGTLFVNDALIVKYGPRGGNGSTPVPWRGPQVNAPDAMRMPIKLHKGRNKILFKVRNGRGDSGFIFAVTDAEGRAIPSLVADCDPPDPVEETKKKPAYKTLFEALEADGRMLGALKKEAGGFTVKDKRLYGTESNRGVPWRKYTVRPGFPKDSPSNFAWLQEKLTKKLDEFRLDLAIDTADKAPPKLCVTFQGDGTDDPLSGWSVMVVPAGDGVRVRVERYDRLVYETAPEPVKMDAGPVVLNVLYEESTLTLKLGETVLLNRTPIRPIPGASRIGLTTWDSNTRIAAMAIRVPKD